MQRSIDFIIHLHGSVGDGWFILISAAVSLVLCLVAIPITTDLMVNHAAGIAGRKLGPSWRTLVINASTNNPECFAMAVSFASRRMGGWANPLGSLLANCYLMYLVGITWVAFVFLIQRDWARLRKFGILLWMERRLIVWHLGIAFTMFACGLLALRIMQQGVSEAILFSSVESPTSSTPNAETNGATASLYPMTGFTPYVALALLVFGGMVFYFFEARLKKQRPNLFLDIDDTDHGHSVIVFLLGTAGLIVSCWVMNVLFLSWSALYHDRLSSLLGAAVFAGLHYVLGAFITSLPELRVATSNYRRLTVADMNTALASASYSNFVNLSICIGGLTFFIILTWFGYVMPWE